jgi:di/tricarboxylate transporter
MSLDQLIVLAVAIGALALFVSERLRPEVVALLVACTLAVAGVIDARTAISGFSSEATVAVGAMFVLSAGLDRSGALAVVVLVLEKLARFRLLLKSGVMAIAGTLSAFVNNTAVVAVLLPVVLRAAGSRGYSPSRYLIPLSYASQFGGVCTLIGTSTNLLVNGLAISAGLPGFTLFEFASLGVILFGIGMAYVLVVGYWLLPDRGPGPSQEPFEMGEFVTEVLVQDGAAVGRTVSELGLEKLGLTTLDLVRGTRRYWRPEDLRLETGDVLRVSGAARDLTDRELGPGLVLHPEHAHGLDHLDETDRRRVEALVPPGSPLIGHTPRELLMAERYNAVLLAIRRHGNPVTAQLRDTRFESGDVLLLVSTREGAAELHAESGLVVLRESDQPPRRRTLPWPPLLIVTSVVTVAALGWLPIHIAALIGCIGLVASRTLSSEEAVRAVDWRVLLLIAGMLPLGIAMQQSGLAQSLVKGLLDVTGIESPAVAVSILYLMTAILTEFMSNNAAAVLMVPIGLSLAEHFGVDWKPFLVAVAFAASTAFATPVGYQTNTMVYNAGNYRFTDFVRVGGPLNVVFWIAASMLIPRFFPF